MKTQSIFQKILVAVLAVIISFATQAQITPENQRKLDQLTEMTTVLRRDGVTKFLTVSHEQKWVAPKMYSAWFINKLPEDTEGKKLVEQTKSAFGLEMVRQLSPVAKVVRETRDAATLELQIDALFAARSWLETAPAYANMRLQQRADDIASIAATKLMCDINYPMEKAEKVMKRFDDRSWSSPERIRQVLYEESDGKHFIADLLGSTQDKLDKEFRKGVSLVIELGSVTNRPDLEIFARENFAQGESVMDLEKTWGKRAHINFAARGLGSVNLENMAQLHEFRKRYGKFPTEPITIRPFPEESSIKAAFREISWENPYGIGGAWATFEAYLEGRLVDEVFQSTDRRFNPNEKSK